MFKHSTFLSLVFLGHIAQHIQYCLMVDHGFQHSGVDGIDDNVGISERKIFPALQIDTGKIQEENFLHTVVGKT